MKLMEKKKTADKKKFAACREWREGPRGKAKRRPNPTTEYTERQQAYYCCCDFVERNATIETLRADASRYCRQILSINPGMDPART